MKKIVKKQVIYFLLISVLIFLIFYLSNVLQPFFIGIFVAYLLDPFVDWFEKKKIHRGISTVLVLLLFFLFLSFVIFLIMPILYTQISSFLNEFPNIIEEVNIQLSIISKLLSEKIISFPASDFVNDLMPSLSMLAPKFLNSIVSSSLALINVIGLLFITPIVSWYLLKDWDKILQGTLRILSNKYKLLFLDYAQNINLILASYLRGQILVSLSLCIYYFLLFFLLDLNYSLFVGFFAGFFAFIPLVGIIISFVITSVLAYLQFVDSIYIIYILVIFIGGQLLESNFLTPKLIGNKLGLHPLVVILSIFIFGAMFGIIGIIFSIPIISIVLLILKRNLFHKKND